MITLTKQQVDEVKERITSGGVTTPELLEDLLDHVCTSIEVEMDHGYSFQEALAKSFGQLSDGELKLTEMETQHVLEGKKTYYPNLSQSIGLIGLIWLVAIYAVMISTAILGNSGLAAVVPLSNLCISYIILGGAVLLAATWIRQAQPEAIIFSFGKIPSFCYPILFCIAMLVPFWTDPLRALTLTYMSGFTVLTALLKVGIPPPVVTIVGVILLEFLFRGIILNGLLKTSTPEKAVFWSSVLAIAISFGNPVYTFLMNLILGWVYWKTRSLKATLFMSVSWVVAIYWPIYFFSKPDEISYRWAWQTWFDHSGLYIASIVLALLLTIGLLFLLNKKLRGLNTTELAK